MGSFLRFLKPMAFLRRRAIYGGLLGGSRKWLVWGGAAWILHWTKNLFGEGEPAPVHTQELDAGERFVILHNQPAKPSRRARRRA